MLGSLAALKGFGERMNLISGLESQFRRLTLRSICPFISSYGRKFNLGAISVKNIGLMLKKKTNKTEPYWKKQQPQTVLARPGSVLSVTSGSRRAPCPRASRSTGGQLSGCQKHRGFSARPPYEQWVPGTPRSKLQVAPVCPQSQTWGLRGLFYRVRDLGGLNCVPFPAR